MATRSAGRSGYGTTKGGSEQRPHARPTVLAVDTGMVLASRLWRAPSLPLTRYCRRWVVPLKGLCVGEHAEVLATTLTVEPLSGALDAVVRVPGSKSITNRALLCAALAEGQSVLSGALLADDSFAMERASRPTSMKMDSCVGKTYPGFFADLDQLR